MKKKKSLEIKVERLISTTPAKAYSSWLNPKLKGTPWHMSDKLLLDGKVNGFFYWFINKTPHYGRFTKIERARKIQHTWMSPYTEGQETFVTVTFKKKGDSTLMTLVHSGLPNNSNGKAHDEGWNYFLDIFRDIFKTSKN